MKVPFNIPFYTGMEATYINEAFKKNQFSGDGYFTAEVSHALESILQAKKVLLTNSCTAALEMSAILLNIGPGDEVIMPSFTFVSTANAFVLRGATPVFVDIDPLTQNIDIEKILECITSKTKAIVVVHYAGISCNMHKLMHIARSHGLPVVEDAAQALYSNFDGQPLGSFGDLATVSFHETKNISCGEGGCLVINNSNFIERAEIIREKGTNRSMFRRGVVDKYNWVDVGSSFLPGEISAAFLWAQLQHGQSITSLRLNTWNKYHSFFTTFQSKLGVSLMHVPNQSQHNAHMYYLIFDSTNHRSDFISHMNKNSVSCVFHYVPLHSSPAGIKFSKTIFDMPNTNRAGDCLVRIPLYPKVDLQHVLDATSSYID